MAGGPPISPLDARRIPPNFIQRCEADHSQDGGFRILISARFDDQKYAGGKGDRRAAEIRTAVITALTSKEKNVMIEYLHQRHRNGDWSAAQERLHPPPPHLTG
jgi:hypothetical protein